MPIVTVKATNTGHTFDVILPLTTSPIPEGTERVWTPTSFTMANTLQAYEEKRKDMREQARRCAYKVENEGHRGWPVEYSKNQLKKIWNL